MLRDRKSIHFNADCARLISKGPVLLPLASIGCECRSYIKSAQIEILTQHTALDRSRAQYQTDPILSVGFSCLTTPSAHDLFGGYRMVQCVYQAWANRDGPSLIGDGLCCVVSLVLLSWAEKFLG